MKYNHTPLSIRKKNYTLAFMWMFLGSTIADKSLIYSSLTRPPPPSPAATAAAAVHILTREAKYDTQTGSGPH
jgi:hypothetical protein